MKPNNTFNKKINHYHESCWVNIHRDIKKYIKTKDNKVLHQLRIDIKKLIALTHFIDSFKSDFNSKKISKSILTLFKLSGEHRDYHHAKQFCKKFNINKSCLKKVASPSVVKKLKDHHKKYSKHFETLKEEIQNAIKDAKTTRFKKYLSKSNKAIKVSLSTALTKTQMHAVRKQMNDILYLSALSGNFSDSKLLMQDNLQNLMGKWHDINKFKTMLKKSGVKVKDKKILSIKREERMLLKEIQTLSATFR